MKVYQIAPELSFGPPSSPEKKLLAAIVGRLIDDYVYISKRKTRKVKEWLEINEYLFRSSDTEWSLDWICEHLIEDGAGLAARVRKFCLEESGGPSIFRGISTVRRNKNECKINKLPCSNPT